MEAIRRIQTVENGQINIQLPRQFWGQEVEVIVLPTSPNTPARKKSLRGCLKKYANPDLTAREKDAWLATVSGQYEQLELRDRPCNI